MTNTAMMIDPAELDYFGRTSRPIAVLCAATITVLGKTDAPITRAGELVFGGVRFTYGRAANGSKWLVLTANGLA